MAAKPAFDLTLYLVVGGDALGGRPLDEVVAAAVRGGVTLVQLREKTRPDAEIVERARALKDLLAPLGVPLIVNDRVEVARAAGADGVHLGQDDLDTARARAILGPDKLIGVSAGTAAEAARVGRASADYVGIGPVYATPTK
ncbi:MAG: thiamine phosphate synthase, partial [Proteobacteria bacterium]|nr:thiamine phosphate synthase [Pseudomonadota bacterium]